MLLSLLLFVCGLLVLVVGAELFLRGAVAVGFRLGMSPFMIGVVIVGFGTSAPELAVNVSAALKGSTDMALGNVVGSNIANVGLILGLSALLRPLAVQMRLLRIETPVMILASLLLWWLCFDGGVGRVEGALLLAGFAAMSVVIGIKAGDEPEEVRSELSANPAMARGLPLGLLLLAAGLAALIGGAELMVSAAIALARAVGVSELLIGLTIVAVGTSLPELASSLVAAWRGFNDVVLGNIIGSNLFNILLILGVTALIRPLPAPAEMVYQQLPVMVGFAVALWVMMARRVARQPPQRGWC
ncbi:MAG: calcium/sodium antiporter [Xanthomonadales bacterium]|nr:calcium/sodium antiporter [Xanthomonadales bacterium]